MSALNAFLSTWSRARSTFGTGVPHRGTSFDKSTQLQRLQGDVSAAAPASGWTGSAAARYAAENERQAGALSAMARLDRRIAAAVDQSAYVVAAGRRDLDAVKHWVVAAAATIPGTTAGERMLWPVVDKAAAEVAEIVARSNGEMQAIAGNLQALGDEYDEFDGPKRDVVAVNFEGDVPDSTLDLADIVYKEPGAFGDPGMMELVPGSGVWVPDPRSRTYRPKRPDAPLGLDDINYYGPGVPGQPWEMELVPGSGAWVPNPNYPGYQPRTPEAPIDLGELEIVDPGPLVPADKVELWPRSGIVIPDPRLGRPS